MCLFANGSNSSWIKSVIFIHQLNSTEAPSKFYVCSANIFFFLPFALNNRFHPHPPRQMKMTTGSHSLEASVTFGFAVSVLPKIKTWIVYRLPPHLLSAAPSVFSIHKKQWHVMHCFSWRLFGDVPSKTYSSYLQNLKCCNAEVHKQTESQIIFAQVYQQWAGYRGTSPTLKGFKEGYSSVC